eukprot:SAG31_NODE_3306_length_4437_cov_46.404564_3_plen_49_part_00
MLTLLYFVRRGARGQQRANDSARGCAGHQIDGIPTGRHFIDQCRVSLD